MTKSQIRKEMTTKRDNLSGEERAGLDELLHEKLYDIREYQSSRCLFTYISFRSEIDTISIIRHALKDQKKVFVPKVEGRHMNFYQILGLNALKISSYGIPEPLSKEGSAYAISNDISIQEVGQSPAKNLMLLPGLAFDPMGNRIGYGGGFYDRYLHHFPEHYFYKIALAYDFQLLNRINSDAHDKRADEIITPTRHIICNNRD